MILYILSIGNLGWIFGFISFGINLLIIMERERGGLGLIFWDYEDVVVVGY